MTSTNTMTNDERVQHHQAVDAAAKLRALSNRDLMMHYRNMDATVRFYERWNEKPEVMAVLDAARLEQQRRYAALAPILYPVVYVETNFKYIALRDATWTAYSSGNYADGRNGVLIGTNPGTGKEEQFDWAHLDKAHPRYLDHQTQFTLVYCG